MYPFEVRDDVFDPDLLRRVVNDRPALGAGWRFYDRGAHEHGKWALEEGLPESALELAAEMRRVGIPWASELFGVDDLTGSLFGGGYHCVQPGGVLGIHADYNQAPDGLWRRANLIVYLNHGWDDEGGHLELWDDDGQLADIVPEFGRTVLMESSDRAWHGHPKPAQRWRQSFAMYLFSGSPQEGVSIVPRTTWFRNDA